MSKLYCVTHIKMDPNYGLQYTISGLGSKTEHDKGLVAALTTPDYRECERTETFYEGEFDTFADALSQVREVMVATVSDATGHVEALTRFINLR